MLGCVALLLVGQRRRRTGNDQFQFPRSNQLRMHTDLAQFRFVVFVEDGPQFALWRFTCYHRQFTNDGRQMCFGVFRVELQCRIPERVAGTAPICANQLQGKHQRGTGNLDNTNEWVNAIEKRSEFGMQNNTRNSPRTVGNAPCCNRRPPVR